MPYKVVGADRLMTCDLHAGQIQGFFDIPVDHLDGSAIFVPYIKSLNLDTSYFCLAGCGRCGKNPGFCQNFGAEMVVCDKQRDSRQ